MAAVGDQVPVAGEAAEALHRGEVEEFGLEDLEGGVGAVDHAPLGVVADDGGAAEALEDADLDLLGVEGDESVEAGGEGVEVLAGEADDQVSVDVDAGVVAEEMEVLGDLGV